MIHTVGWMILVLMTSAISAWSLHLYFLDKDKRKLMFSLIFFISIFIFVFNVIDGFIQLPDNIIFSNLFQWLTLPAMTAILVAVVESFSPSKDFEKGFLFFLIFLLLSFSLVFFPFEIQGFLSYTRMGMAIAIIPFSLYQFVKWKNIQSFFFLTAVGSFSVAGMSHASQQLNLSIFGYAIAYIFLGSIFLLPSSTDYLKKDGINTYFSLQKKLDHTRLALKESKELYKSIVENTQDVILLTKPNGVISYVSPSSNHIFGYKPEEMMVSEKWFIPIYPDDEQVVQDAMKKGLAGYPVSNLEYRITVKDGSVRWISHSWSPIKEGGEVITIVSSIRDITDLKHTQQKLANQVNNLEKNELATLNIMEDFQDSISSLKEVRKKIQEKNIQLEKSQDELQKLNDELEQRVLKRTKEVERLLKQKDAFIDQLGHDLKHPLGPLINLIPLLKKQENDKKKKEILTVLERNVDYMKRLVIRTIQLAKLNSPSTTFEFETVHFIDLVQSIIEKNIELFNRQDVQINTNINDDLFLTIDSLQVEEVIENLFSNAVKYGSAHGTITIDAEKHTDEYALISIKDTGQGMTQAQIENIFDEFYKADESRHDFLSTGLGLSICKRIIEKHGGEIWVESPGFGEGTTIHLTLPLAKEKHIDKYISY